MQEDKNLKIFFLFPQQIIFESIADNLIENGSEAFIFKNHVQFKEALRLYSKNTIAFINIDSALSENGWIEYVRDIKNDNRLRAIEIGILSFNPDKKLIETFKKELEIECGYHILSTKNKQLANDISDIVMGHQKVQDKNIIRVDCNNSNPMVVKIKDKSFFLKGNVNSLSSIAMSMTIENDILLKKGLELNDINISYGETSCKLTGIVMGNSQQNKQQYLIKFSSLVEDFYKKPLFKIMHKVMDSQIKEQVK